MAVLVYVQASKNIEWMIKNNYLNRAAFCTECPPSGENGDQHNLVEGLFGRFKGFSMALKGIHHDLRQKHVRKRKSPI